MHDHGAYIADDVILGKAFDARLMGRLLRYVRPFVGTLVLALVSTLLATASFLAGPYIVGLAIDEGILTRDRDRIVTLTLLYALAEVGRFVFTITQIYLLQYLGQKVMFDLRMELFAHMQRQPPRFFDKNPVGRLVTRVTNDIAALAEMFSSGVVSVVGDVFLIGGLAGMMFWLHSGLALAALTMLPFILIAVVYFRGKLRDAYREVRRRLAVINATIQEDISGMKVIQLFTAEEEKTERFRGINDDFVAAARGSIFFHALFTPVITSLSSVAIGLVLYRGGVVTLEGAIGLGVLVAFINYTMHFFEPIRDMSEKYTIFQAAMASAERVFQILDTAPAIVDPPEPRPILPVRGEVHLDRVWFRYNPSGDWVLQDVSFMIAPGERVALVGATGAGKSTTLALLTRFYDVERGAVRIDGVDVREVRMRDLRSAVGLILQDVFLFSGSIRENLLLGEGFSPEALEEATRRTRVDRLAGRLPKGLDTEVHERGLSLSTGERQLIAFGRTLLFDPAILLLDEATASVDVETERRLQEAMREVLAGRTSLIVAHRLSTIEDADRILVLDRGRIVEEGRHEQLLARGGIYRDLYERQMLEREEDPDAA